MREAVGTTRLCVVENATLRGRPTALVAKSLKNKESRSR
jgi:hypothetical protein